MADSTDQKKSSGLETEEEEEESAGCKRLEGQKACDGRRHEGKRVREGKCQPIRGTELRARGPAGGERNHRLGAGHPSRTGLLGANQKRGHFQCWMPPDGRVASSQAPDYSQMSPKVAVRARRWAWAYEQRGGGPVPGQGSGAPWARGRRSAGDRAR